MRATGRDNPMPRRPVYRHMRAWLERTRRDAWHGLRLVRRAPGLTLVTTLILSLGIGINVWIFSTMNALLIRPLPGLPDADRLVAIGRTENGAGFDTLSRPNLEDVALRQRTLTAVGSYTSEMVAVMMPGGRAERVRGSAVDGPFFSLLGVPMRHGRGLVPADVQARAPVAVVSAALWERLAGRAASADSTTRHVVAVNRTPLEIVGVASPAFSGLAAGERVDVWMPLGATATPGRSDSSDDPTRNRAANWLMAIGRLQPRATLQQAREDLRRIALELARDFPDDNGSVGIAVEPLRAVGPAGRPALTREWLLFSTLSAVVLLVVCFSVATLLLARATSRGQEMAVRISLGASRTQLVEQVLTEHAMLVAGGLVGGGAIAWLTSHLLQSGSVGRVMPVPVESVPFDWRVLTFMTVLALASSVMVGLPSALSAARLSSLNRRASERAPNRGRARSALIVTQVALSVTLLVAAALLTRSLQRSFAVDLGFDATGVVTAYYDLQPAGVSPADGAALHARVLDTLRDTPGVTHAALGLHVPLQGASRGFPIDILRDGVDQRRELVRANVISEDFFGTLATPILRGREFTRSDTAGSDPVALVNETCLRRCFDGANPIGREIRAFREPLTRRVVGVIKDSKYSQPLEEVRPTIYIPLAQSYTPRLAILVKTNAPAAVAATIADTVGRVATGVPIDDVATLSERLSMALWVPQLMSALAAFFGVLTVALASLGVYGVVAQATTMRAPEIAVRIALGATHAAIVRMVMREGLRLIAIGVVIGAVLAASLSSTLRRQLYGVDPLDAASFAGAIGAIALVTLAACILPARRATAIDPARVLKG